ncbi:MAG: universal stress protein [Phascolarctobacterium sp.]|nr:universal stress protein [Phascolarctobacterium sp.]MCD8175248.1 universal stress protein [Phascolarctobacterium sp.]
MYKKILVPVDGSEGSWRALKQAMELGRKFESKIVIVNVIQPYNNVGLLAVPMDTVSLSNAHEGLQKVGNRIMELAKEKIGDYPHGMEYVLEVGHPSERIISFAKKSDCDVIIIGSRGLSGIAEFFLGSVSSKVSQYAEIPVLIVK